MRPWLEEMPAEPLATYLIGGIAISDLPGTTVKDMMKIAFGGSEFVMAPFPTPCSSATHPAGSMAA